MGKVLLASAPDDVAERALRPPARATRHTVVEPGRPHRELAEVRRRGCARTAEAMSLVAVPVTANREGTPVVVGALGVVVPSHRRDPARLVPVLEVAARGTGREVGRTAARFHAVQPHAARRQLAGSRCRAAAVRHRRRLDQREHSAGAAAAPGPPSSRP